MWLGIDRSLILDPDPFAWPAQVYDIKQSIQAISCLNRIIETKWQLRKYVLICSVHRWSTPLEVDLVSKVEFDVVQLIEQQQAFVSDATRSNEQRRLATTTREDWLNLLERVAVDLAANFRRQIEE